MGPQLPLAARRPEQQPYLSHLQAQLPQQHLGGGGGLGDASFIGGLGGAAHQDPREHYLGGQMQQASMQAPAHPPKQRKQKPKTDKKAEIQQKLAEAWTEQWEEMQATTDFKKGHILPLARIKKIMKIDEDVRMISAEAPIIFGKACELFIIELTMRAWQHTEQAKRRTLQRTDVRSVVMDVDVMDFLMDVVPAEEPKSAKREGGDQEEEEEVEREEEKEEERDHSQNVQMGSAGTAQMEPQDQMQMVGAGRIVPEELSYGISSSIDSRSPAAGNSASARVNGGGLGGLSFGSDPR